MAKPYLDKKYGHACSVKGCEITESLEVDHKKTRGSRHDLKFDVKNVQYLCFYHHRLKTDGKPYKGGTYEESANSERSV